MPLILKLKRKTVRSYPQKHGADLRCIEGGECDWSTCGTSLNAKEQKHRYKPARSVSVACLMGRRTPLFCTIRRGESSMSTTRLANCWGIQGKNCWHFPFL